MANLIGQTLGRYHILEQLGEGGMAVVYKAYDTQLERHVAIKIIRRDAFPPDQMERMLKRFEREARALARLNHPNIVKVLDYGQYEQSPFIVMEFLPGNTLKHLLPGTPIPWKQAARFLLKVAKALDYAHQNGIIHRDVKPSNILINEARQPVLSDFGIARIVDSGITQELTATGLLTGTPEYMSPEQAVGAPFDQRVDIYALGIIFYEMLTGRKPYMADTPMAVLVKQASEPLPRPTQFVPDLPGEVEGVLLKALAKNMNNRYGDMAAFSLALSGLLDSQTVTGNTQSFVSAKKREDASFPASSLKPGKPNPKTAVNIWRTLAISASILLCFIIVAGAVLIERFLLPGAQTSTPVTKFFTETTTTTVMSSEIPSSPTMPVPMVTPTITFEPCISPQDLASRMGWLSPTLADRYYGGYKVYVPAQSSLPLFWGANGYENETLTPLVKQIFEYDTDRDMFPGIWLIYVPYHCRAQFGYLGRNTPVPNIQIQENLLVNGDFNDGALYPWEIGERHHPGISFVDGLSGKSICSQQNLTESDPKGWVGFSQEVAVTPGQTYHFQSWVKLQSATAFHIHVDLYKGDQYFDWVQLVDPLGEYPEYNASSDWQFIQGDMTIPAEVTRVQLGFWHGVVGDEKNAPNGTVCADDVEFGVMVAEATATIAAGTSLRAHTQIAIGDGIFADATYSDGLAPISPQELGGYDKIQTINYRETPGGCAAAEYNSPVIWIGGSNGLQIMVNGTAVGTFTAASSPHGFMAKTNIQKGDMVCALNFKPNGYHIVMGPDVYYHYDSYCYRSEC
jgi:serine/threonine protein kinase